MELLLKKKKFLGIFSLFFAVFSILTCSVIFYIYKIEKTNIIANIIIQHGNYLDQRKDLFHILLEPAIADLNLLANSQPILDFFENSNKKNAVEQYIKLFAQNKHQYKQIRLLNREGKEILRINRENNDLKFVPKDLLQDKSNRPYFIKTKNLKPSEVYISPIDLNIENKKIEIPIQRVIRICSPIYNSKKELTGIIIINQYLNDFFEYLKIRSKDDKSMFMIINTDSYWIFSQEKYKSFGFMIDSLKNQKFSYFFPDTWDYITKQNSGNIQNDEGLFVFRNLKLNESHTNINNYNWNNIKPDVNCSWTLVLHLPKSKIIPLNNLNKVRNLVIILSIIAVLILSHIISRLRFKELSAMQELNSLNLNLEQKIQERTQQLDLSNQELNKKTDELTIVNKELEAFSYSVSHDLRAPLRHISGFADLLFKHFRSDLPDKAKHYLDTIKSASHEMSQLIQDLLNFSRIGRVGITYSKFNMSKLVNEIITIIENEHPERNVEWKIDILPEVNADYSLLRQVWINLVNNAVKYSSKREVSIIEIGSFIEKDKSMTCFFIKDNGVGFDMNYAHKLFDTFQRLHSSDEYEGTGIGLANVRRIVSRHNGTTWAESEPDKGATFYFSLPQQK